MQRFASEIKIMNNKCAEKEVLRRDCAPSWAALMISGAEATFLAGLAQPDHSGPVRSLGHGPVSGSPLGESAGGWRRMEGGGAGGRCTSWGIRFRSLVNSVCNLRECDR